MNSSPDTERESDTQSLERSPGPQSRSLAVTTWAGASVAIASMVPVCLTCGRIVDALLAGNPNAKWPAIGMLAAVLVLANRASTRDILSAVKRVLPGK